MLSTNTREREPEFRATNRESNPCLQKFRRKSSNPRVKNCHLWQPFSLGMVGCFKNIQCHRLIKFFSAISATGAPEERQPASPRRERCTHQSYFKIVQMMKISFFPLLPFFCLIFVKKSTLLAPFFRRKNPRSSLND